MIINKIPDHTGSDYNGVSECVDKFHIWAMHLANAFYAELSQIDIYHKLPAIIKDINCIKDVTDKHITNKRPISIKKARFRCKILNGKSPLNSTMNHHESLSVSYSNTKIEELIQDRNHCPLGIHTISACGVDNFGQCGYGNVCWNWVCNGKRYNDNTACGCNNGCFEQNYYCNCKSRFSVECWGLIQSFINTDSECHTGSTCVKVEKLENIGIVNECMDETFWDECYKDGDPYVWLFPTEPIIGRDIQTNYVKAFDGNELFDYDIGNNRHCWSMRMDSIRAELWDFDWDYDDFEYSWGDINIGGRSQVEGIGVAEANHPKITMTVQRRGW